MEGEKGFYRSRVSTAVERSRCNYEPLYIIGRRTTLEILLTLCAENDFEPQFVQEHLTVTVSASLRRGDAVAMLEARDADLTSTCDGNDCPCARLKYAIESGNEDGLFAIDGSSGLVSAASDLADHDGQVFKLHVSVVNDGAGLRDVRGPKIYGSLTVIIGQQSAVSAADDADNGDIHIRHKRASVFVVASSLLISLSFANKT